MADEFDRYFDKVYNANKESAKTQMEFQERMSSTAHQREVKDLIAAGLNPVLSANNGASSPMGAYASIDSSPISAKFARENLNKELQNARLITAMQNDNALNIAMRQLSAQIKMQKYTTDENNKTSRFNNIVSEYGPLAGLVYGMSEGMYNNVPGANGAIGAMSETSDVISGLLSSINGTGKNSEEASKVAQAFIDFSNKVLNGEDTSGKTYFYGDNTIYSSDSSNGSSNSYNNINPKISKGTNTNSKFANTVNSAAQKVVDFIKNTSPKNGRKPPQYNKNRRYGAGHARSY